MWPCSRFFLVGRHRRGGPRPGTHGLGSFSRNKRTSSCGAEPPHDAPRRVWPRTQESEVGVEPLWLSCSKDARIGLSAPPGSVIRSGGFEWHTSWFGVPKVYERIHSHLGDVGFHVFVLSRKRFYSDLTFQIIYPGHSTFCPFHRAHR